MEVIGGMVGQHNNGGRGILSVDGKELTLKEAWKEGWKGGRKEGNHLVGETAIRE